MPVSGVYFFGGTFGPLAPGFGISAGANGGPLSVALQGGLPGGTHFSHSGGALRSFDLASAPVQGMFASPTASAGSSESIDIWVSALPGGSLIEFVVGLPRSVFAGSPVDYSNVASEDWSNWLGTLETLSIWVPPYGNQTGAKYFDAFANSDHITSLVFASTNDVIGTDGHALTFAAPEPASMALVGLGLVALSLSRRRQST